MAEEKTAEFAEAKEAILGWLQFAETAERERSPIEAPIELTLPYLRLEAAWALYRVSALGQGDALANPLLEPDRGEPAVPETVRVCYASRLREARSLSPASPWPNADFDAAMEVADSDRRRYQVMRLAEQSYILSPTRMNDFFTNHWKGTPSNWTLRPRGRSDVAPETLFSECKGFAPDFWRSAAPHIVAGSGNGLPWVRAALEAWKPKWWTVTDSYNTNELFCLTVIQVFDTFAFALAQAVNPLPLDEASEVAT